MKNIIGFIGLVLVLLSANLYIYSRGLVDGKLNYQHSINMQFTLDSAYKFGYHDGERIGFTTGYVEGYAACEANFLKLTKKQKRQYCK